MTSSWYRKILNGKIITKIVSNSRFFGSEPSKKQLLQFYLLFLIGTFYFFAKTEKELPDLKFIYAGETEKTVSSFPLQQNHATNIKGEYSNLFDGTFIVTADDTWTGLENVVEFGKVAYKLGDVYPDATAPIGIVCWVDPTHPSYNNTTLTSTKGKIVSLDEKINTQWSTENVMASASNTRDGATNTAKILALPSYSITAYPAFAWCAEKRTTQPDGINWYIPAENELKDEIQTNKATLNTVLVSVSGATQLSNDIYWSSTESFDVNAWYVNFDDVSSQDTPKNFAYSVRVVSAF